MATRLKPLAQERIWSSESLFNREAVRCDRLKATGKSEVLLRSYCKWNEVTNNDLEVNKVLTVIFECTAKTVGGGAELSGRDLRQLKRNATASNHLFSSKTGAGT